MEADMMPIIENKAGRQTNLSAKMRNIQLKDTRDVVPMPSSAAALTRHWHRERHAIKRTRSCKATQIFLLVH